MTGLRGRIARLEAHHAEANGPTVDDVHGTILEAWQAGGGDHGRIEAARANAEAVVDPVWPRKRRRLAQAIANMLELSAEVEP